MCPAICTPSASCLTLKLLYVVITHLASVHMCMGVESSTGAWETYQWPCLQKEWFSITLQLSPANSSLLSGGPGNHLSFHVGILADCILYE